MLLNCINDMINACKRCDNSTNSVLEIVYLILDASDN